MVYVCPVYNSISCGTSKFGTLRSVAQRRRYFSLSLCRCRHFSFRSVFGFGFVSTVGVHDGRQKDQYIQPMRTCDAVFRMLSCLLHMLAVHYPNCR